MTEDKALYCKNGEVVYCVIERDCIKVLYKNKVYKRDLDAIGNTLFEYDPIVKEGSVVDILEDGTGSIKKVRIYVPDTEVKYYGMGGSFYGARTKVEPVVKENIKSENIMNVSTLSPVGAALLNHRIDDVVEVILPNGKTATYTIKYIINYDCY